LTRAQAAILPTDLEPRVGANYEPADRIAVRVAKRDEFDVAHLCHGIERDAAEPAATDETDFGFGRRRAECLRSCGNAAGCCQR
jgi:hypothetical protein